MRGLIPIVIFAWSVCFVASAKAQDETPPPMPLEDQETMETLSKIEGAAKNLETAITSATIDKKISA